MLHSIATMCAAGLVDKNIVPKEKQKIYVYGFELLYSFSFFLIFATSISLVFGYLDLLYTFLFFFVPIRVAGGGYHANTYGRCFLLSNAVSVLAILISMLLWNVFGTSIERLYWVIFLLTVMYIWNSVPVKSKKLSMRPERLLKNRKRAHGILIADTIIAFAMFCICDGPIIGVPPVAMVIVAILVLLAKKGEL